MNATFDDGDNLTKFFGTIKKFNMDEEINQGLRKRIESHFDYKWDNDKNQAFLLESDINNFRQLPSEVQTMIYKDFLFSDFLETFKKTFAFPKLDNPNLNAFYSWQDFEYKNFMIDILQSLEPRSEPKNEILINELDEQNEVLFFNNGTYEVGYEINRVKKYVLRFKDSNVIGAYQCTFNKRSMFIYKTVTICMGYSIRKVYWQQIFKENIGLADEFTERISREFRDKISSKVMREKKKDLQKWNERADYEGILSVTVGKKKGKDSDEDEEEQQPP